jgi:octaprenyl-diphosphate synthase
LLEITSEAVKMMSEGELLQIEKARRLDIDEDIYFDIVRRKTASLIASCCACGMAATNNNAEDIARMKNFGEKVGIAFQIKDDLFDYENKGSRIGKPTGIDIKEQKMTLPLIYALRNADKSIKRKVINTIKNNNNDPKKVSEVIDFVLKSGGIEYSIKKMREYEQEALDIINHYPDNEFKKSLIGLVAFTTNRNH